MTSVSSHPTLSLCEGSHFCFEGINIQKNVCTFAVLLN